MNKSDLKTGMKVKYSNGQEAIVFKDLTLINSEFLSRHEEGYFIGKQGFMPFSSYNDNLTMDRSSESWNIVEVSLPTVPASIWQFFSSTGLAIFKRFWSTENTIIITKIRLLEKDIENLKSQLSETSKKELEE